MARDTAAIRLEGVAKRFTLDNGAEVEALSGIDLAIGAGEFVALIGPSGCGKSTILRLVAALETPSAGRVTVEERAPEELARGHRLGVAFQDHALLPWLSVAANVGLPFRLAGRAVDRSRVAALLSLVGLQGFETARPRQLSGGMRQRAAIARALALSPELLLLDEPFGALDAVTRRRLNIELQRIWSESRITTLLVTHAVDEAIFLADRVLVMSGRPGRIIRALDVPFARPRGPEVMRTPEFHHLVDELTLALDPASEAP
jgi:NitT/TauT family transport system ATP-binding protein